MKKCRVLELIGGSLTDGGAETLVTLFQGMRNLLIAPRILDDEPMEEPPFLLWTITLAPAFRPSRAGVIYVNEFRWQ